MSVFCHLLINDNDDDDDDASNFSTKMAKTYQFYNQV